MSFPLLLLKPKYGMKIVGTKNQNEACISNLPALFRVHPHLAPLMRFFSHAGPHLCAGEQHPNRHQVLLRKPAVQPTHAHLWANPRRKQGQFCLAEWVMLLIILYILCTTPISTGCQSWLISPYWTPVKWAANKIRKQHHSVHISCVWLLCCPTWSWACVHETAEVQLSYEWSRSFCLSSVLTEGEHTLTKTIVTSKIGKLAMFTKKKSTCIGCKSVLDNNGKRREAKLKGGQEGGRIESTIWSCPINIFPATFIFQSD